MEQNTSHAVMAQRHESADSLDFFPTPPWATRALCEWIGQDMCKRATVWEPACGQRHMSRALAEYFWSVHSSDIYDYGDSYYVFDFLLETEFRSNWIITNPPFNLAEKFALTALDRADSGVALLVRTSFLESVGRYERLFKGCAPTDILQFTERVPMHKGRLDPKGSTATAYCWLVWRLDDINSEVRFHWIAPCRKRLERASDYE